MWVSRVIAIRNAGERTRGGRGKRGKCQPGGLSGEAGNAPSLLARKGERNPLQGFRATIERTVSNPSANFIVATLHRRDCSLKFDLSSDETPATGSRQSFAHFDSPGHCKSMLPGFCFSCGFSAFFRSATSRVAACRQDTDFRLKKTTSGNFRIFPAFSALKMSTLIFLVTIPDRWTIYFSFVKIITEKSNG